MPVGEWIEWKGEWGKAGRPVKAGQVVEVRYASGRTIKDEARWFMWDHPQLVAYRIIKESA